jgi:hypothetical protein
LERQGRVRWYGGQGGSSGSAAIRLYHPESKALMPYRFCTELINVRKCMG